MHSFAILFLSRLQSHWTAFHLGCSIEHTIQFFNTIIWSENICKNSGTHFPPSQHLTTSFTYQTFFQFLWHIVGQIISNASPLERANRNRKRARVTSPLTEFLNTSSPMDRSVLLKMTTEWHFPHCYSLFEIASYRRSRLFHSCIYFPNNLSFLGRTVKTAVSVSKGERVQLNIQILLQSCTHETKCLFSLTVFFPSMPYCFLCLISSIPQRFSKKCYPSLWFPIPNFSLIFLLMFYYLFIFILFSCRFLAIWYFILSIYPWRTLFYFLVLTDWVD